MGLQQNPTIFLILPFRKSNPHPSLIVGNGHYSTSLSSAFNMSSLGAVICLCNSPLYYAFLKYCKEKEIYTDVLFGTRGRIPLKWRLITLERKVISSKSNYYWYKIFWPLTARQQTRDPCKNLSNPSCLLPTMYLPSKILQYCHFLFHCSQH